MSVTESNRKLIEGIFAELAQNNPRPFADALAEDVRWKTPGSSVWSRTFAGKEAVLNELLGMVRVQLVERVRLTVQRIQRQRAMNWSAGVLSANSTIAMFSADPEDPFRACACLYSSPPMSRLHD